MKYVLAFFVLVVIVFSCKKKDDSSKITITPTGTTGTTGTTGAPAVQFKALCSNQKRLFVQGKNNYPVPESENTCIFSDSLFTNYTPTTGQYLSAGNMKLNNVVFKHNNGIYTDTTKVCQPSPFTWHASGATIPTFNYINLKPYPAYGEYTLWPDTIHKWESFKIPFQGVQGADEVELSVSSMGSNNVITYTATVGAKSIHVSTVSIAPLLTSTPAVIQCTFYKNDVQNLSGTTINFRNVTTYMKYVKVMN